MWEWKGSGYCGRASQTWDCFMSPCWDSRVARPGNEFCFQGLYQTLNHPENHPRCICLQQIVDVKWPGNGKVNTQWNIINQGNSNTTPTQGVQVQNFTGFSPLNSLFSSWTWLPPFINQQQIEQKTMHTVWHDNFIYWMSLVIFFWSFPLCQSKF